MLLIQKILTMFLMPLGAGIALLALCGLSALRRRRGAAWMFGVLAVAWLWLWSAPVASDWLRGRIETVVPGIPMASLPKADAIIVLGGGMEAASPPLREFADLGPAADRVWHAARLYRAGKAPFILTSGGNGDWGPPIASEAAAMAEFLADMGVPADAIVVEGRSRTTAENARYSRELASARNARHILLVTSAWHMPRAIWHFEHAGFRVTPAPTDYEVIPTPDHVLRWLPDGRALEGSGRAFKEIVGLLVCRAGGC